MMNSRFSVSAREQGRYVVIDSRTNQPVYSTGSYSDAARQARELNESIGFGSDGPPAFMLTEVAPYVAGCD